MRLNLKYTLIGLLLEVLIYISCKKEHSCENCDNNSSINKPPIAVAGPDQVITLPTDSVSLDGNASSDPDGTISSFLWTKISGPASCNINNASTAATIVKNLVVGIYKIELKVTDDKGLSAKDTMQIIVNDPSQPNRPPVANAGTDQTIALPTNTITVDGSASTDPDNNIISYLWTKISGPSSFNISNANAVQTQVTNLVQGVYQFELKVTDAGNLFSKDTMQVTVNDQPPPPPPLNCDTANRPKGNANLTFFNQLPESRYGITVATVGNKIFIAGGFTSYTAGGNPANFSSRVDVYDIISGQWTITQLSEPRAVGAVAVLGNKIFFAGGYNDYSLRATVDIYDLSTNSWSITQLSQARWGIAGGVIDNKVFFDGGFIWVSLGGGYYNPQLLGTVDVYDAASNSWSTASLSAPRYNIFPATTVEHKIFFAGGNCDLLMDCASNRIDIYDAATNTWSYEDYIPQTSWWVLFSGIGAGNKNYWVTGDYWEGGKLVEIRDEITHTTSYVCLSGTLYGSPVRNGNKLIFPVSSIPMWTQGFRLTHFDVYDLATNIWSIQKLPPLGVDHPLMFITVNNEVYAIDGYYSGTGFLYDKVYKLEF